MSDTLGDRIKRYELAYKPLLTPRSVVCIRVDGKAFHTFTRGCEKPFDQKLIDAMVLATADTASKMMGFKLAYTQSDEATFMISDFDTLQTQGWFGYELNKIVSITASMFTAYFNKAYGSTDALFDARAFVVPADDWQNVFIWRQRDWERNSIQMLARAHFSHKECEYKKVPELHELLFTKGINWANCTEQEKNGTFVLPGDKTFFGKLGYEGLSNLVGEMKYE